MTPVSTHREPVREEWVDYNGHLSEAYYVLVFGFATDAAMSALGLGSDYRDRTHCSLFTVEAHVRYLDQVDPGVMLDVQTSVIGVGAKTLRLWHEMYVDGTLRATEEVLCVHVDVVAGSSVVFAEDVAELAVRSAVEAPPGAGRSIG